MFYVYARHMKLGHEQFCDVFDTAKKAIEHIETCYRLDKEMKQLGELYYFMKEH